ncbi:MAG: hypothetical protein AABM43_02225 [Actinomycetota bacterium]
MAIAPVALFWFPLADPSPAHADWGRATQVMVALLPNGTGPGAFASEPRISPGLLSAGIGDVPATQTYLDIGQGNRVSETLYDGALPRTEPLGTRAPHWQQIVDRADSAPADIVSGLLASTLRRHRLPTIADETLGLPALLAADWRGLLLRSNVGPVTDRCPAPVCVLDVTPADLRPLVRSLRGDDLLIALERPPPQPDHQLTIGIAGHGFDGNLTSDSTRMRGYVLSTDLAPTILRRLGVPVPSQMNGEPIRSEGDRDVAAVVSLEDRLASIVHRRGGVIRVSALIWVAIAALAAIASRGALARPAARMLALSAIYLPLLLLVGAATEPSQGVERLILLLGAPLLAVATLVLLPGYRALALACVVAVLAFAIDVIAGSPLTPLSLIGPDPGLGVRFYGIGNELEATLVPLILVGTGAAITVLHPDLAPRRAAAVFLFVGFVAGFIFAFGRFGADVGAAIVLPAGAAMAVAALEAPRRAVLLVVAVPLVGLAVLAVLDLLLGGDAHLTRSVLDAGGLNSLGDVAERRLRLSAHSFSRGVDSPLVWLAVVGIAVALYRRDLVLAWFAPTPALRAGFIAAAFATLVGTLANDSGALLLEVGTVYLLLIAGFAWAQAGLPPPRRECGGLGDRPSRPA